jgi:hypothetical protein
LLGPACFARIPLQFFCAHSFKSGRPTIVFLNGRNRIQAQVELNQKFQRQLWSPRLRTGFDYNFDMVPQSVSFPFSNSSFPFNIYFRGPKYSPSISWFVSKTTKSYQGTAKKVCITCTWRLLFIAILMNSCFSC